VVRVSKRHGAQVVRANPERWSRGKERVFFQALFETGNVRAAARAAGVSTTAIYNRRRSSEPFREAWAVVLGECKAQLEMNSVGAANRALDGIEPGEPPRLSTGEAVAVFRTCARQSAAEREPTRRFDRPEATDEEMEAAILQRLEAIRRQQAAGESRHE
jgi:hypothetical protein